MNRYVYLVCIFFISLMSRYRPALSQVSQRPVSNFLIKAKFDRAHGYYGNGTHIEVKQIPQPTSRRFTSNDLDDRDIIGRSRYSRADQIKILGEYLKFRGDTSLSNKSYEFKAAYHMTRPQGIQGFTVEIEALFSFTRMLTIGIPPIKPMLIDCRTGRELNTDADAVNKIFDVYIKWYDENKKTDFRNIILPLSGSGYCWAGEAKGMDDFLKKSF